MGQVSREEFRAIADKLSSQLSYDRAVEAYALVCLGSFHSGSRALYEEVDARNVFWDMWFTEVSKRVDRRRGVIFLRKGDLMVVVRPRVPVKGYLRLLELKTGWLGEIRVPGGPSVYERMLMIVGAEEMEVLFTRLGIDAEDLFKADSESLRPVYREFRRLYGGRLARYVFRGVVL